MARDISGQGNLVREKRVTLRAHSPAGADGANYTVPAPTLPALSMSVLAQKPLPSANSERGEGKETGQGWCPTQADF